MSMLCWRRSYKGKLNTLKRLYTNLAIQLLYWIYYGSNQFVVSEFLIFESITLRLLDLKVWISAKAINFCEFFTQPYWRFYYISKTLKHRYRLHNYLSSNQPTQPHIFVDVVFENPLKAKDACPCPTYFH